MWYKIEKIFLPCVHFSICLIISLSQVMGGLGLMGKRINFLQVFFYSFVGNIANIFDKKNWALLTKLLKVKNDVFARQCPHTKT